MKFSQLRSPKLFALLLTLLACVSGVMAQTTYGALRGLVKDPQGAVLASADVTLTNQGTGITRTEKTSSSGEYTFTAIEPGVYSVAVSMTGFKKTETKGVTVNTGSTETADMVLSLGGSSETVEVTAAEPLIDSANANGGQSYSSEQLTQLPNLGRNPFVFEKLDVAVTPVGDPRYVRAEDQTGQSTISIAGAPIGANNFAVDGIPISQSNGGVTFIPSLEAVSDVKVQANTYDAEVGRAGGGLFNTTLKSGNSQYHGVLYGVTRQTNWSANSFVNNQTNITVNGAVVPGSTTPRPAVETYLYAGAFGGPVPLSEKSRWTKNTFFWVVEDGYRQAQPLTGTGSLIVPTPAERMGDFTADLTGTPAVSGGCLTNQATLSGIVLYDPTTTGTLNCPGTGATAAASQTRAVLQGIKNGVPTPNVIPAGYINPIGQYIANVYPACNYNCTGAGGAINDYASDDFKTRSDMYSGKLDHAFAPWWTATLSYVHLATQEPTGSFIHTIDNSDGILHRFNDATAYNNVFQLNASTILTAGYGFNRYYSHQVPYSFSATPGGFNQATGFGGTGFPAAYAALVQSKTFPSVTVSGVGATGGNSLASLGTSDGGPTIQSSHNFVVGVAKTLGKQEIKGGYVYRALSNFQQPLGSSGAFTFNGTFTSKNGSSPSAIYTSTNTAPLGNGGSALADLLLGYPGGSTPESVSLVANVGNFNQQIRYHAFFVQDDFRATQKFTVNVGVRYEYELGQREAHNQYVVGFNPNFAYTFPCNAAVSGAPCATAHGGLEYAGQGGYPTRCCGFTHAKISPRIGLAYEAKKGTVVRGGFGLFYAPVATVVNTTGYSQTTFAAAATPTVASVGVGTAAPLSNPFGGSGNILAPSGNSLAYLSGIGGSVSAQASNRKYPLVEQYSFNVQQEMPLGIVMELGYIGAHSMDFPQNVSLNQVSDGTLAALRMGTMTLSTTAVANPYYAPTVSNGTTSYPTPGVVSTKTVAPAQLLLPYPQFAGNGVTSIESVGFSHYNALTVKVQKHFRGLTVLGTYTWSSNWDNFYGAASAFSSSLNSTSGPQDNYNTKGEYARAVNNIPNRMTAAINYALPFGRGRALFSNMPRILDYVLGGYEINSVSILQNGSPLSITQTDLSTSQSGINNSTTGFGGTSQRPTLIGNPCYSGSPEGRYGNNGLPTYFNTAAFAVTPAFTYSTMPRTLPCQGPGYANTDLSVNKTFTFHEKYKVQFRAEALNVTNTPEFANPGLTFSTSQTNLTTAPAALTKTSTTGILQGTVGFNRIIQMGGRFNF